MVEKCHLTSLMEMESKSFEMSSRRAGAAAAFEERNFVFVVGGVEYPCCRFQAILVSGLVRRLLAADYCVSRLHLKVSDNEHHFKDIVSLMNGQKISITAANAAFLAECARELENDELLSHVDGYLKEGELCLSNAVERIRCKSEYHVDCTREFAFIASHFSLFEEDPDVLGRLSVYDLEMVLTNPSLKLDSEDQLYDLIMSLVDMHGDDYLILLRYVEFPFLTKPRLQGFLGSIFPGLVDASVWQSICACLLHFCDSEQKARLMKPQRYHGWKPCKTRRTSWTESYADLFE